MANSEEKVAELQTAHEAYHDFVARYRAAEHAYDEACSVVIERASLWEKNPVRSTADALRVAVCDWRRAGVVFVNIRNENERTTP